MGLVRKILLVAGAEGLILQPLLPPQAHTPTQTQNPTRNLAQTVLVDYKTLRVRPPSSQPRSDTDGAAAAAAAAAAGLEIYGVVGLLRVASSAYVVGISKRRQVARVWGRPIYVVTGVVVVPVSTQKESQEALRRERDRQSEGTPRTGEGSSDDDDGSGDETDAGPGYESLDEHHGGEDDEGAHKSTSGGHSRAAASVDKRGPGIAEQVLGRSRQYGRFADRWFSRRGWTVGQRLGTGLREEEAENVDRKHESDVAYQRWPQTPVVEKDRDAAFSTAAATDDSLTTSLLPKLVQTTKLLLSSQTFYFSYDFDITRCMAKQRQTASSLPLHYEVDVEYFWNQHLLKPFVDSAAHELALPIMQGFVGQREFAVSTASAVGADPGDKPGSVALSIEASVHAAGDGASPSDTTAGRAFLLTLISRRSTRRCGLRYLRRGIDEQGNVANAVETEQILSSPAWDASSKIYSFVQTRGSIPLFFSQLPYSFKPPPVLNASPEANRAALRRHFDALTARYGRLQAVSLVDKHEPEGTIGAAYESAVADVKADRAAAAGADRSVDFEWFEFHSVCRGMKFENVSLLVDKMLPFLAQSGFTTLSASGTRLSQAETAQTGVVRTNCMDCLDRTNVVQSALAQQVLSQQLAASGLAIDLATDPSTMWFNTLWADNGDAISRAYTGTSALKGDYTRTRKRNALGALTDLSLTLSRFYRNLFEDFFTQAAIDYLLGCVRESVFADFEASMTTLDPAIDLHRARDEALATAAKVVVEEREDLLHGWCLLLPAAPGSRRSLPLVEALLLLSDAALYVVHFDWAARKVASSERVGLERLVRAQRGVYITETHTPAQTDPARNVGFVVEFRTADASGGGGVDGDGEPVPPAVLRVNTRSLENTRDAWSITGADGHHEHYEGDKGDTRVLAFKALPARTVAVADDRPVVSEREGVRRLCEEIKDAVDALIRKDSNLLKDPEGSGKTAPTVFSVEEKDVLSLDEARRNTGIVETLTYSFKKAIWG